MCERIDNGSEEKPCFKITGFPSEWCNTCKIEQARLWEKPY